MIVLRELVIGIALGGLLIGTPIYLAMPKPIEKCPAPWKVTDKTIMPSTVETLTKAGDMSLKNASEAAIQSRVVLVMACEPLGVYRVETETNP